MENKKLSDKEFDTLVKLFVVFVLAYFISGVAMAAPIRIAVLDSGYDYKSTWSKDIARPKLCDRGHKSYVGKTILDDHGHGTHVAGLIAQNNQDVDYCLVIIKVFNVKDTRFNLENVRNGLKYAADIGVDIINYSGDGVARDEVECSVIGDVLRRGIKVVAAAGNEHSDLITNPYYPAMCDSRIYKITATTDKFERLPASNYASKPIPNIYWELGDKVMSLLPNNRTGVLSGTSMATAIFTQRLVRLLYIYKLEEAYKLSRTA